MVRADVERIETHREGESSVIASPARREGSSVCANGDADGSPREHEKATRCRPRRTCRERGRRPTAQTSAVRSVPMKRDADPGADQHLRDDGDERVAPGAISSRYARPDTSMPPNSMPPATQSPRP